MKILYLTAGLALPAIALLGLSGCDKNSAPETAQTLQTTNADDVREQWRDFTDTLMDYSIEERDAAVAAVERELQQLDAGIARLQNQMEREADQFGDNITETRRTALNVLKQRRAAAKEWTARLKNSSADAWEDIKQGFASAYGALSQAFTQAEAEFENIESQQKT